MDQKIPTQVNVVLKTLVTKLVEILNDNFIGLYIYGSLAMGGYNPDASDMDLLVVVKQKLLVDIKEKLFQILITLSEKTTGGGFEFTIVKLDTVSNQKYPLSSELFFEIDKKDAYLNKEIDFNKEEVAESLAVDLAIIKERGLCFYGKPIAEIFPTIKREDVLNAIMHQFNWSYNNVMKGQDTGFCWVPLYAVLNCCRLLAYTKDYILTSKAEGGIWGIKHLPKEYTTIIETALREYKKSDKSNLVDAALLKKFLQYSKDVSNKL